MVSAAIHSDALPVKPGQTLQGVTDVSGHRGPALRGVDDPERLQPQPEFGQFPHRPVEIEHEADRGGDHCLGAAQDKGAGPAPDLDQAHKGKHAERLAHHRQAHPEPVGQFPLGGQPGALGQLLADDQPPDPLGDFVRHAREPDRLDARQVHRLIAPGPRIRHPIHPQASFPAEPVFPRRPGSVKLA